jgi:sporulation protein YlmC with PRC-barrel domain
MKRSILRAVALCLTTTFVACYAQAKDDNDKSSSSKSQQQGAPGTSSGTYSPGIQTSSSSTASGSSVRLTKLMNTSLKGQTGESLGQVQDIIADPTSGQIQFVVLSLSPSSAGAPGTDSATSTGITTPDGTISSPRSAPSGVGSYGTTIGSGKLVAVPWRLISHSGSDQFTATVDRTKLQSAPTFSTSAWPTMDSAWMQRVYSHFGVDASTGAPGTGTGTGTGTSNPSTPGLPSTPGTPDINPPSPGTTPSTTPGTGTGTGTGAK